MVCSLTCGQVSCSFNSRLRAQLLHLPVNERVMQPLARGSYEKIFVPSFWGYGLNARFIVYTHNKSMLNETDIIYYVKTSCDLCAGPYVSTNQIAELFRYFKQYTIRLIIVWLKFSSIKVSVK